MELVRDKRIKDAFMNSTIQNMFDRGELRKDHPLQREPDQWSRADQDGLIATVIKDEDIDSIKVCEQLTPQGVILWVIDGLQRLTTLSGYRKGGFAIGRNIEYPIVSYQEVKRDEEGNILKDKYDNYIYETIEYDLRGKRYDDLPPKLKETFDNYKIDVVKHLNCTNEEIGYHIRRYNKQKSMNAAQNAVTYMDNVAKEVKRVSRNSFFKHDGYSEKERNNGTIDRIVTETVMCMFHFDNWQKQSKKMGAYLNDNSSEEEFDKLDENLNRLELICGDDFNHIFTSKDSFVWFTIFDKFTQLGLEDQKFIEFLTFFSKKLNGDDPETFYGIDKKSSTKDKNIISKKLSILEKLMLEFFQVKEDNVSESEDETEEEIITDLLGLEPEEIHSDMELYNKSLSDLTDRTIKDGSKLLNEGNRLSLLTMVIYSYKEDKDLEGWMEEYAKKNNTYFVDQRKNFLHMLNDFEKYEENIRKKSA